MALSTCGPPNPSQLIANGLMYPLQYEGPTYTRDSFPEELLCIPFKESPKIPCAPCDVKMSFSDGIAGLLIRGIHRNTPSYLVILFHGNGVDIGIAQKFWRPLVRALPIHLLIVEYPGYGIMNGRCCSDSVRAVADHVYDYCTSKDGLNVPTDRLIIFGRSIGSGPACYLAQRPCCMLCLISPFTSIRDLSEDLVGRLSSALVSCKNFFNNVETVENWKCENICIMHGMEDEVIRSSHSSALHARIAEKLPSANTRLCMIPHVGHNDLNVQSHIALKIMLHFRSFFRAGCPMSTPHENAPAPGLILNDENVVRMIDKVEWDPTDEDPFEPVYDDFDDISHETFLHKLHHHRRHSKRHKHRKIETFPESPGHSLRHSHHHHHDHKHRHHHHHHHHHRRLDHSQSAIDLHSEKSDADWNPWGKKYKRRHSGGGGRKRARFFQHKHHHGGFYHGGHRHHRGVYSSSSAPIENENEHRRREEKQTESLQSEISDAVDARSNFDDDDDDSSLESIQRSRSETDCHSLESQSSFSLLWNVFTRR